MGAIVCATRGGQGSRAAQLQAIKEAKETGERLVFLYVVDINSIGYFKEALAPAIRAELRWLGRALLHIARQRAEQEGLQAKIVLREGNVKDEIEAFLQECRASLLLLGAPRDTTRTVFGDDAIEKFAHEVEVDTGLPVRVVRPEEVP